MTAHRQISQPDLHQLMLEMMQEISAIKIALARATIQPAPEWVTVGQAAKQLGVTPQTIRRKIDAGQIQAKGSGKTRQVRL